MNRLFYQHGHAVKKPTVTFVERDIMLKWETKKMGLVFAVERYTRNKGNKFELLKYNPLFEYFFFLFSKGQ